MYPGRFFFSENPLNTDTREMPTDTLASPIGVRINRVPLYVHRINKNDIDVIELA